MPNALELALGDHFLDFPRGDTVSGEVFLDLLVPLG